MTKFLHTSDLHLAKPFGRFDDDLQARLREARFEKISKLASAARENGATVILIAGDTFDAETPPPTIIRHAMREFERHTDITWVLMPGNHDSLAASDLWERVQRDKPENVILALEPEPLPIGQDILIMPAPPTSRNPGRDLTEWMEGAIIAEADQQRVRIGLAHGSIQEFGNEGESGIIPPDRPARADLDYLALGDWHGRIKVGPRCWYSGTPETDAFKHDDKSGALLVEISQRGAVPGVTVIDTSSFKWRGIELDFRPGDSIKERLDEAFPTNEDRRSALVEVRAVGRLPVSERADLADHFSEMADDFSYFRTDISDLAIEQQAGDLDNIDTGGALRSAAENLSAEIQNEAASDEDKKLSSAALARLYDYAMRIET